MLVESVRTERGPRQRVVAYPGTLDESTREAVAWAAGGRESHDPSSLFEDGAGEQVVIDPGRVRVANVRSFGPFDTLRAGRRYIIGTPKSMLKKYERHLLSDDWSKIRDGLEVK